MALSSANLTSGKRKWNDVEAVDQRCSVKKEFSKNS